MKKLSILTVLAVTATVSLANGPASADPGKIAFTSVRTGVSQIFSMLPDGTAITNVSNDGVPHAGPAWSADGTLIGYAGEDDVSLMNANGSGKHKLGIGHGPNYISIRPHTSYTVSYSRFGGFDYDIYTANPDGTGEVRIINNALGDYGGRWNSDGTKLTYFSFVADSTSNIYVSNPDGSGQIQLTNSGTDRDPSWSPDGSQIVFASSRDGNSEIYLMNADGSHVTRLTNTTAAETSPVFSPDGGKIAFATNRDGHFEIYKMNADGSSQTRVTTGTTDNADPCWGQDIPAGAPSVSISDVSLNEGNSGTSNAQFTISLSAASTSAIGVTYRTVDGTALAGKDYTAVPLTTVTFAPGTTSKLITVPVIGNKLYEPNKNFTVRLAAVGAQVAQRIGTATIVNDDAVPSMAIGNVSLTEGNSGSTAAKFPVTLNAVSGVDTIVSFTTADSTATAGSDYTATSGTLTIPAGSIGAFITVAVIGDTILEDNETFLVKLSNPHNATFANTQAVGTINNDDTTPGISIGDVTVGEGGAATFAVMLSHVATVPVAVKFATADGTALAGSDYTAASGSLTIPVGHNVGVVKVVTLKDSTPEISETFVVNLNTPTNAVIVRSQGMGTITDDDFPDIFGSDVAMREGNSGARNMYFTVALSEPAPFPVSVNYATADVDALAGSDYVATQGSVNFAAGQLSAIIAVPIMGDTVTEPDETFVVNLTTTGKSAILTPQLHGTILNDDAAAAAVKPSTEVSRVDGNHRHTGNNSG